MSNHQSKGRCPKLYFCDVCGEGFTQRKGLVAHNKTCQENDNDNTDEITVEAAAPGSPMFDASESEDDNPGHNENYDEITVDAAAPDSPIFDASESVEDNPGPAVSDDSDREETVEVTVPVVTVPRAQMLQLERFSVRENLLTSLEEGNLDDIIFFMEQEQDQEQMEE